MDSQKRLAAIQLSEWAANKAVEMLEQRGIPLGKATDEQLAMMTGFVLGCAATQALKGKP